jgi:hypothetical protein
MYGYALCFGYDPREFWPVSAGALGTATETEAQHRKAGAKGGLDFVLGFAEAINRELPDTLLFEFEERDMDGELAQTELEQAQANMVMTLYEKGVGVITGEESRVMLAERGLIDSYWTLEQEDTVATDEGEERSIIQRAAYRFPDEDIVRYTFRNNRHSYRVLQKPTPQRKLFHLAETILPIVRDIDNEAANLLEGAAIMVMEDDSQEAYEEGLKTLTEPAILREVHAKAIDV